MKTRRQVASTGTRLLGECESLLDLRLSTYLKTMKYVQRPELPRRLESIFTPELSNEDMEPIIHYIDNGPLPVSREVVQAALRERLGRHRQEQIMGHISREFEERGHAKGLVEGRVEGRAEGRKEGRAEGRKEGRAEGRKEGEAKALVRILEKRFGKITSELRKRIFASNIATILAWSDRAFEARDLQSIFQSPERG